MPKPKILTHLRLDGVALCQRGKNPGARVEIRKSDSAPDAKTEPPKPDAKTETAESKRIKVLESQVSVMAAAAKATADKERKAERAPVVKAVSAAIGEKAEDVEAVLASVQELSPELGGKVLKILRSMQEQIEGGGVPTRSLGHGGDTGESDLPAGAAARVRKHTATGLTYPEAVIKAAEEAAAEARGGNAAASVDYVALTNLKTSVG